MKTAIRKHLPDFLAILGLLVVAAAVSTVILGKQRLALPDGADLAAAGPLTSGSFCR